MVSDQQPPRVSAATWTFTLTTETGLRRTWDWADFRALPAEKFDVDLHSAQGWSVLSTHWVGVPLGVILDGLQTTAEFAQILTYSDYQTTVPLEDLQEMPTWIAHHYEGRPIPAARGGPARMLIPHLYLFKSAKWISGITLSHQDEPGVRERDGHHPYGDPWREQRRSDS